MQNYRVTLRSNVSKTFRCSKAANSLDIDVEKKSVHEFNVAADLDSSFSLGLIVGASGSGKTTLAKQIYGDDCFEFKFDESKPIIDQFPESMNYEECALMLAGIGLTSVPCWIRPVATLSNGQKARAIAALQMATRDKFIVDEWTSVVDRTVAKAMSHCLQKFARKVDKRVVVLSCHYDVIEWLNPDWIIDCNKQAFIDRRLLWRDFERTEKLNFNIRSIDKSSWRYFSKYHYLSDRLPGGYIRLFGLFHGEEQIGFQCFANYVPHRPNSGPMKMHVNRTVIHPDYVGLGLGMPLINETSKIMIAEGYDVHIKFSSKPIKKGCDKFPHLWRLENVSRNAKTNVTGKKMERTGGFRMHVKTYSYKWIGSADV